VPFGNGHAHVHMLTKSPKAVKYHTTMASQIDFYSQLLILAIKC